MRVRVGVGVSVRVGVRVGVRIRCRSRRRSRVLLLRAVHRELGPTQPAGELAGVPGDTLMSHHDAELVEPRLVRVELEGEGGG